MTVVVISVNFSLLFNSKNIVIYVIKYIEYIIKSEIYTYINIYEGEAESGNAIARRAHPDQASGVENGPRRR